MRQSIWDCSELFERIELTDDDQKVVAFVRKNVPEHKYHLQQNAFFFCLRSASRQFILCDDATTTGGDRIVAVEPVPSLKSFYLEFLQNLEQWGSGEYGGQNGCSGFLDNQRRRCYKRGKEKAQEITSFTRPQSKLLHKSVQVGMRMRFIVSLAEPLIAQVLESRPESRTEPQLESRLESQLAAKVLLRLHRSDVARLKRDAD